MEIATVLSSPAVISPWFLALQSIAFYFKNLLGMAKRKQDLEAAGSKKVKTGHWSFGLVQAMNGSSVYLKDDNVTVIKDKYPKARHHYLVIPNRNISSLKSVTADDLGLLQHMHATGERVAKDEKHRGRKFLLGYHARPSMERLHLHVVSDDFVSEWMKSKKHWNSYNTKFFMDSKGK